MSAPRETQTDSSTLTQLLRELCAIHAPGGYEQRINDWLVGRWTGAVDDLLITPVGNLIAHIKGNGPRLLICAHADEIGYTVRGIGPHGFLSVTMPTRDFRGRPYLRGPYAMPIGQDAVVLGQAGDVPGVFGSVLGHLSTSDDARTLSWDDIFVDVWASDRGDVAEMGVEIGSPVVWNPPFRQRGPFVSGKALDDRVGLAILDCIVRELDRPALAYDLYVASTVLEEQGLLGAASVNKLVDSEYAIALDVGLAGDVPGVDQLSLSTRLGGGPILVHRDLYTYNVALTRSLKLTAKGRDVPIQDAVFSAYGSDGGELVKAGVATALVTVPTRYTHSPIETAHVQDMRATVDMLTAFLVTAPRQAGPSRAS